MCDGAQTMEPRQSKNTLSWQVPTRRCSERRLRAAAMAMPDAVSPDLLTAMQRFYIRRWCWA